MTRQKSRPMVLRLRPAPDAALDAIAKQLGLDRCSALRFLVMEKARELGLPLAADDDAPPVEASPVKRGARR